MPADVMILTGEMSLLDYLVRPFVESVTKSFRESGSNMAAKAFNAIGAL